MMKLSDITKSVRQKVSKSLKGSRDPVKVKRSLSQFYVELDKNIVDVISTKRMQIECKEGCSYCCSLKVDAKAHEIFLMADYIEDTFSADAIEALKARLKQSADKIAPLSLEEHFIANIPCGLLVNGECSVYSVRPSMCRKCHSTSQARCIESYERPTDTSILPYSDKDLNMAVGAAIVGFDEGLKKSKLDITVYEINRSLLFSLESPRYKQEWRNGSKAFPESAESKK